jgi:hypothetical protein
MSTAPIFTNSEAPPPPPPSFKLQVEQTLNGASQGIRKSCAHDLTASSDDDNGSVEVELSKLQLKLEELCKHVPNRARHHDRLVDDIVHRLGNEIHHVVRSINNVRSWVQSKPNCFGPHTDALVAGLADAVATGAHADDLSIMVTRIVGCYYADATEAQDLRTFLELGESLIRTVAEATDPSIVSTMASYVQFIESEARLARMRE